MDLLILESRSGIVYPILESPPRPESGEPKNLEQESLKAKILRAYQKLEERLDYHERVCSELRHIDQLRVLHACNLPKTDIERRLDSFFKRSRRKHGRWLLVDSVLALLGSLLTPIPGPNVFFLYPAIRAYGHYCARKGVRNYRKMGVIHFETDLLIDQVQIDIDKPEVIRPVLKQLEDRYNLDDLEERLVILRTR